MFLKKVRIKKGKGSYTYLRILESYRDQGRVRQRVLANLGNLQTIPKAQLAKLSRDLAKLSGVDLPGRAELDHRRVFIYGPVMAIRRTWDRLGLSEFFHGQARRRRIDFDLARCVYLMVLSRLIRPTSKLQLTQWHDRLWCPGALAEGYPAYQHYLRSLDQMARLKGSLQRHLFDRLTDLFRLKLRLAFFDLTSSYFEGTSCGWSRYGYSRDRRRDKKQIVVGLLMTGEGLPIGHFVFRGNRADTTTLKRVVRTVREDYQVDQCVLVGDRGLVSGVNLDMLVREGFGYLMALRKRLLSEVADLWEKLPSQWTKLSDDLKVKEYCDGEVRYLVCLNGQKQVDDWEFREDLVGRMTEALVAIETGEGQDVDKLARAVKLLAKAKASKFFKIDLDNNHRFRWLLRDEVVTAEQDLDGIYVLKTDQLDWSAEAVIERYKDLAEVEDGFRELKSFIEMRPFRHYANRRVLGHVSICVLALLIERMMDLALAEAKLMYRVGLKGPLPKGASRPDHPVNRPMRAKVALDRLDEIKMIESELGDLTLYRAVRPSHPHQRILEAVGIDHLPLTYRPT